MLSETRKRSRAGRACCIARRPGWRTSWLTLGIEQDRERAGVDRHPQGAAALAAPGMETGSRSVLPVTLPVAAAWGRQYAQPHPVIDALIAATARVHGMTVVTRNVEDFELAGVEVLNPFAE